MHIYKQNDRSQKRLEVAEKINVELSEKLLEESKQRRLLEENFGKLARFIF